MIKSKKVVVVMPAYNASKTLEKTYNEIPFPMVDEVILVDDHGSYNTYELAKKLGINHVIRHQYNKGYGKLFFIKYDWQDQIFLKYLYHFHNLWL